MTNHQRLAEQTIKMLPVPSSGNRVHYFTGAKLQGTEAPKGFGVRVTAGGAKSFVLNYTVRGREHRVTIGSYPDWSAVRAVRRAKELRQKIDRGENPLDDKKPAPVARTVGDVLDDFISRYARNPASPLRSAAEYESTFDRLVKPKIGRLGIYEVRRSDIVDMLDTIADERGDTMADRSLAYVRKAFNWYAARDDRFTPPIVPGMARTKPRERARTRVLSDGELCTIWPALEQRGTFGAFVKMLLLTGQRRDEIAGMHREEIVGDVWTIPPERHKSKRPHAVPLSSAVRALAATRPAEGYLFASSAGTAYSAFAKEKIKLDSLAPIAPWRLHDIRRTAKVLMVRAGVRPDISERVLGHTIAGVEGVYDRYAYADEKREALERLAAIVGQIIGAP